MDGWNERLKDDVAAATLERCGICCAIACSHCKTENCQDRLAPHIENWRTAHGPEDEAPNHAVGC